MPSGFFSELARSSESEEESMETRGMLGAPELKDMAFVGSFAFLRGTVI
jgi:hypothetical protein